MGIELDLLKLGTERVNEMVFKDFIFKFNRIYKNIVDNAKDNNLTIKTKLNSSYDYSLKAIKIRKTSEKLRIQKEFLDDLKKLYTNVKHAFDELTLDDQWVKYVELYSDFILLAEKCFMYRNESSIDESKYKYIIYSEVKDNIKAIYFRFLDRSIKVRMTFKKTQVSDIEDDSEDNYLRNYINTGKTANHYVTFVNLFITRDFGKQVCNEFNFINDETPIFNNPQDIILYENIRRLMSLAMEDTFRNICENYLESMYFLNPSDVNKYKLSIEDILNENYWFV